MASTRKTNMDNPKYEPIIDVQIFADPRSIESRDLQAAIRSLNFNTLGEGVVRNSVSVMMHDSSMSTLIGLLEDEEEVDMDVFAASDAALTAALPILVDTLNTSACIVRQGGLPDAAISWLKSHGEQMMELNSMTREEYMNNQTTVYIYARYIEANDSWMVGMRLLNGSVYPIGVRKMYPARPVVSFDDSENHTRSADSVQEVTGNVRMVNRIAGKSMSQILTEISQDCKMINDTAVWVGTSHGDTVLHKYINEERTDNLGKLCLESELSLFLANTTAGAAYKVLQEAVHSGEVEIDEDREWTVESLAAPSANIPTSFMQFIAREQGIQLSTYEDTAFRKLDITVTAKRRIANLPYLVDVTAVVEDKEIGLKQQWGFFYRTGFNKA